LTLAAQVAANIGPEKILAKMGGGKDAVQAAFVIHNNLKVEGVPGSSVIHITFQHPDPEMVRPVLNGVIAEYLDKHEQVHKAIGLSNDKLMEETTQLRQQIAQTEAELLMAKTNAGIISIADSEKAYSEEISRIRRELFPSRGQPCRAQIEFERPCRSQGCQKCHHECGCSQPAAGDRGAIQRHLFAAGVFGKPAK